jgi:type VI secretion system VgrG family protein
MKTQITLNFESPAFEPDKVQVSEIRGTEQISQLFSFQVHLISTTPDAIDEDKLLTEACCIVFLRKDVGGEAEEVRRIFGMVKSVKSRLLTEARQNEYILEMVPRVWQSTLTRKNDIYQDLDISELLAKKLEEGPGLSSDDFELRLKGSYDPREFIVQYEETDLNFIQRWTEHFGIFYFFDHSGGKDKIIFADSNADTLKLEPHEHPFMPRGELSGVYEIETVKKQVTTVHKARDYNYRNPAMDVAGDATAPTAGSGEDNEFGTHVKTPTEATLIAQVRAEQAAVDYQTITGKSEQERFTAGGSFKLEGHPNGDLELLVTRIRHIYVAPATGMAGDDTAEQYKNEFDAILFEKPYRPPRTAIKPRVAGVLNGIVQSEAPTDFGALDDEGRYRVAFMYDSVQRDEGKASRPLRMAQPSAGTDRGMHFPLKAGTEVLVYCVNGDPDRPIIAGAVPNPQTGSPVTAANAEKTHLKTNVSDMVFDDAEPRMKLSVDGTNHVFQVGMPNAPEEGFVTTTTSNISTMTNNVNTAVSTVNTAWQDYKTSVSGKDICEVAGVPSPWSAWSAIQKVLKAAVDTAKAASAAAGAAYQFAIDEAARGKKEAEDDQKKAREHAVDNLAEQWDEENPPQEDTCQEPNPYRYDEDNPPTKTNSDGTTSPMTEDEWRAEVLKTEAEENPDGPAAEEAQNAQDRVDAATKDHKEAEDAWKNSPANITTGTTGEVVKTLESALTAAGHITTLFSWIGKKLDKAVRVTTEATMAAYQGAAATVVSRSGERSSGTVGVFSGKHNIQGSMDSAALFGKKNVFVSGNKHATFYSPKHANIVGGKQVSVKSVTKVEAAAKTVQLTSKEMMDIHSSDEMKLVAHPSMKSKKIPGGNSFHVFAKKGILMQSETKDFGIETKDNVKVTAKDKDMLLDAKKGNWGAHGKKQAYLGCGGGSGYGLIAKTDKLNCGKLSSVTNLTGASPVTDNGFQIKNNDFEAKIKDTRMKLTPSRANFKSGGSTINVKKNSDIVCTAKGKFKAKGSKVMLG